MAGLTPTGFVTKSLQEILAGIQTYQRGKLGQSFDVSAETPQGAMNGSVASPLAELWELLAKLYASLSPNGASGQILRNLGGLVGVTPLDPKKSTATLVAIGTNGTALASGRVVSVSGTGKRFATTASATIANTASWAASTTYAVGDIRTRSSRIYYCISAGVSASGPSGTATSIADGTCTWRYLGDGTAHAVVACEAEDYGPTIAVAGTLSVIETSVGGWALATNATDAILGRNVETDEEYRLRRNALLQQAAASTLPSLVSGVFAVSGVTACSPLENTTDTTDVNGMPPHSFEMIVSGGTDAEVASAILSNKPAGGASYGNTTITGVADVLGNTHTIKFSRPVARNVYLTIDLIKDNAFPADGADQIKAALVAYGATLGAAQDVVRSQLFAPVDSVPGVYDITNIRLGFSASPSGTTNLAIDTREIAAFDTSRIVVNVT